jgi:hypothetical protein
MKLGNGNNLQLFLRSKYPAPVNQYPNPPGRATPVAIPGAMPQAFPGAMPGALPAAMPDDFLGTSCRNRDRIYRRRSTRAEHDFSDTSLRNTFPRMPVMPAYRPHDLPLSSTSRRRSDGIPLGLRRTRAEHDLLNTGPRKSHRIPLRRRSRSQADKSLSDSRPRNSDREVAGRSTRAEHALSGASPRNHGHKVTEHSTRSENTLYDTCARSRDRQLVGSFTRAEYEPREPTIPTSLKPIDEAEINTHFTEPSFPESLRPSSTVESLEWAQTDLSMVLYEGPTRSTS